MMDFVADFVLWCDGLAGVDVLDLKMAMAPPITHPSKTPRATPRFANKIEVDHMVWYTKDFR
jgi:hypothetical protein